MRQGQGEQPATKATAFIGKYGMGNWKALEDERLAKVDVGAVFRQELGRLRRMVEPARRGITNVLKRWAQVLEAAGEKEIHINAKGCPVPLLPPTTPTSQLAVAALLAVSRALTACDKAKLRQRGRVVATERFTWIHALALFMGHHASVGPRDEWSLVPFSFVGETFDVAAATFIAHICHPLPFALRRYGQLPRSIIDILKLASNACQQSWATNELIGSYHLSTLLVILGHEGADRRDLEQAALLRGGLEQRLW